jgi:hypothetical protein
MWLSERFHHPIMPDSVIYRAYAVGVDANRIRAFSPLRLRSGQAAAARILSKERNKGGRGRHSVTPVNGSSGCGISRIMQWALNLAKLRQRRIYHEGDDHQQHK